MYNQEDPVVAEAQKIMLDILKEVHKVCVKNDITYWLDAGTLLGAIRHKGFIPWDDDVDICMERDEYERFLKVAPKDLPEGLFLQTRDTDKKFPLHFAKVRKLGTELIETGETGKEDYCHGIYIDVFPYDYYPNAYFISWVRWATIVRDRKKKYPRGSLKRVLVTFYTNVVLLLPVFLLNSVKSYCQKHLEWFNNKNWPYCSYGLDCAPIKKTRCGDVFPVNLSERCFEGESFYIPNNPDGVLESQFENFMELPPVNQRKIHAKKIRLKV